MAEDIFGGLLGDLAPPPQNIGWKGDFVKSLNKGASELGVSARDLALAIGYETEGTFDSARKGRGLAAGRFGLIQAGPEEAKTYGFSPSQTPAEQVDSVVSYLKDRGLKPGMGLKDIYSTINAGAPGLYSRSDRPGETVETHVARMSDPKGIYAKAADDLLAGTKPVEAANDDSWAEGIALPESPQLAPEATPVSGAPLSPSGATWGRAVDFGNKLLLGAGTPIMAGAQAGKEAIREVSAGTPIGEAIGGMGDTYSQARDAYHTAQAQWAEENPGQDLTNMLVGATIPTVAALAATKGKAGPLVEQGLTSMSPRLGPPVAKFLAGEAGKGGTGVGNKLLQLASEATAGVLEGSTAGAMQHGLSTHSLVDDIITGGEFGGAANPLLKRLAPTIKSLFDVTVTRPIATLAQKAKGLGIELTGPQLTRDSATMKLGAKAGAMGDEKQLGQYTRAVSKEFGENTDSITQDVLDSAKTRIGSDFENVAKSVTQNIGDKSFMQTLKFLQTDALNTVGGNVKDPSYLMVKNWVGNMGRAAQNGLLDGETYRTLTRGNSTFSRGLIQSKDPYLRYYGGLLREGLNDALERTVTAGGPSNIMNKLKIARQQWAALKQVEPIAQKSASGVINPQQMARLSGSKTGNLSDLAHIGQLLPKTLPTGGVKPPASGVDLVGNLLSKIPEFAKTLGAAAGGGLAATHGVGALGQLAASPMGMLATGAGLAAGGSRYIVNKYIESLMHDPRYAAILTAKGLGQAAPAMPFGAQVINAAQQSAIPAGISVLNQEE